MIHHHSCHHKWHRSLHHRHLVVEDIAIVAIMRDLLITATAIHNIIIIPTLYNNKAALVIVAPTVININILIIMDINIIIMTV